DTTVVGLITNNDESYYCWEVSSLVSCWDSNMELSTNKTVEMITGNHKNSPTYFLPAKGHYTEYPDLTHQGLVRLQVCPTPGMKGRIQGSEGLPPAHWQGSRRLWLIRPSQPT
ncbi:hypothetical protein P4O66_015103, partial [Electrophorus voltai]